MQEQRRLEALGNFIDDLRDGLGGIGAAADLDDFRGALEFVRERFDLLRERGGKHQRLALLRQRADNLPDGREKTHVQHPVGFVEDEVLQLGKIGVAAVHQIHQPSGAGDDEMRAGAKGVDLRIFADAAKNGGDAERQIFAIDFYVLLDLQNEFARGRDDERAGAARAAVAEHGRKLGQHRQRERRRLAGAGLRDADEVVAGDDGRNRRRLDGRGFGVAGFLDGLQNFRVETEGLKWHGGKLGTVRAVRPARMVRRRRRRVKFISTAR